MEEEKKKDGVSVKELESYAKKNLFEIFFCILFILASLFTLVFWGPTLSVLLAGVGGIIGVLAPHKLGQIAHTMASKLQASDKTMQMIIGIVVLLVAIFLAPLIFLFIGGHAGKSMIKTAKGDSPHQS